MKNSNLFDISGKVIVITGATGALGGSIAEYLLKMNAKIVILGRNSEKVENTVNSLKSINANVLGFTVDVLNREDLVAVNDKIIQGWQKIDVLINAVGGNLPGATITPEQTVFDMKMEDFKEVTELNLDGSVVPSLVFGETIAEQKAGNIINVSSMAAMQPLTRAVGYAASKAAISNFTQWMATEMALKFGDKIRVNAVAPGFFIGNQNRALLTNEDGSYTERGKTIINNTPMKRFGDAKELNGAIHWLISDAASFVTGIIVPVDGGFSAYSGV